MPVRHGRDALGHGEGGAGGDGLDAETLGHAEAILDVRVLHAVLHVVAEQGDADAGVVEFPGDGLPCLGVRRGAPLGEFCHGGLPFGLLPGARRRTSAATAGRGHLGRARQCFAMVRHQLSLAQADLDKRSDDGFGIGAGDPIEAVGDGANLNAPKLRVDHLRGKRPAERHGRQREPAQIPSCEFHSVPFSLAFAGRAAVPPSRKKVVPF